MLTLIMNYHVNGELKTEIKQYASVKEAAMKVAEVKSTGIWLTPSHYGLYKIDLREIVPMSDVLEKELETFYKDHRCELCLDMALNNAWASKDYGSKYLCHEHKTWAEPFLTRCLNKVKRQFNFS